MTPTALIIEDEPACCYLYHQILAGLGINATSVQDGAAALHVLQNTQGLDVIILDIRLAQIDGVQLFAYIAQAEHLKKTAVVVITAHVKYRDVLELRPHDRFLLKPVTATDIRETIHSALSSASNLS